MENAMFPAKELAEYQVFVPYGDHEHAVKAEKLTIADNGFSFTIGDDIVAHFPVNTVSAILKVSK